MKPIEVKDTTYMASIKEINDKDAKRYTPNWSEAVFVIKEVKNTVSWTYVINNLNGEEIVGTFYEKELQKASQEEFRIEKSLKEKEKKLNIK